MISETGLPSHLRPTTRECVHLVTLSHIRAVIAVNPMLHANLMALCVTEPELWSIKVLHCGNGDFRPFCSCDLDLDPMTFIHDFDQYSLEI